MNDKCNSNRLCRPYGVKWKNSNLPDKVPVIGLGCSSFSTFFMKETDTQTDSVDYGKQHLECSQENAHLIPSNNHKVQEWIATIVYAIENGITLLDTAPWYGHGSSEVVIGYAMRQLLVDAAIDKESGQREEIHSNNMSIEQNTQHVNNSFKRIQRKELIINTKVGRYDASPRLQFDFSYDMTLKSAKRSVSRMNCGYIDVLQLHDPEFAPSMDLLFEETLPALLECKRLGYAKAIGLTGYPLETQHTIFQRAVRSDSPGIADLFDQSLTYGHFNLHNQDLFTKPFKGEIIQEDVNADADTKISLIKYCHSRSIATMAAAPLSMGLLTHQPPPEWHPANQELKDACCKAAIIAHEHCVDLPTLAVLFAIAQEDIGCTLLGMGSIKEVDAAINAMRRIETIHDDAKGIKSDDSATHVPGIGHNLRRKIFSKLAPFLTESEHTVLKVLISDNNTDANRNGPFANIWKREEYNWDGLREANNFWSNIPGGKTEAEARMRVRTL
mmetsp:Transcript_20073/g.30390  ORF Transcript_20073/g.30390 Transcript_20073/m.30390 type:complete len:500 (-) Transcript_20073:124-1623(-)